MVEKVNSIPPSPQGKVTDMVRVGVRRADVKAIRVVDTDMVILLTNGKKLFIRDGAVRAMMDPNFTLVFTDEEMQGRDVLQQAGPLESTPLSTTTASEASATATPEASALKKGSAGMTDGALEVGVVTAESNAAKDVQSSPMLVEKGFFSSLNPAWGAVGALGVLGGGSGGGASAVTADTSSAMITGVVVLGPVLNTNDLKIVAYDAAGNVIGITSVINSSGAYSIKLTAGYRGVVTLKLFDTGAGLDYADEATTLAKSLGTTQLRAVTYVNGSLAVVNITPLTELAVLKMAMGSSSATATMGNPIYTGSASDIVQINKAVASSFKLSVDEEITALLPRSTVETNGQISTAANAYGLVLAIVSGAEIESGQTTQQVLSALSSGFTVNATNGTGSLGGAAASALIRGANAVASQVSVATSGSKTAIGIVNDIVGNTTTVLSVTDNISSATTNVATTFEVTLSTVLNQDLTDANFSVSNGVVTAVIKISDTLYHVTAMPAADVQSGVMRLSLIAGGVTSLDGTPMVDTDLSLNGLGGSQAIDTRVPTISQVVVSGMDANGVSKTSPLLAGDQVLVVLTTSESVTGIATGAQLSLTIGSSQVTARYVSSLGNNHSFVYTVQAGDLDSSGGIDVVGLTLSGPAQDGAGNPLATTLPAQSNLLRVDAVAPRLTSIVCAGSNVLNGGYQTDALINAEETLAGNSVSFTVTFDSFVTGVTANQFELKDSLGQALVGATPTVSVSGSGTTYTVTVGAMTGITSDALRLNVIANNSITNASGNKAVPLDYNVPDAVLKQIYAVDRTSATVVTNGITLAGSNIADGDDQFDARLGTHEIQVMAPVISANATSLAAGAATSVRLVLPTVPLTGQFTVDDLYVSGGAVSNFQQDASDPQIYTFTFIRAATGSGSAAGEFTAPGVVIKANAYTDTYGNASAPVAWLPAATGGTFPTVDVTMTNWTTVMSNGLITSQTAQVTFGFSYDPLNSLTAAGIAVTGGTLGTLSGTGLTRTATFTRTLVNGQPDPTAVPAITVLPGSYEAVIGATTVSGAGNTLYLPYGNQTASFVVTFAEGVKGVSAGNFALDDGLGGSLSFASNNVAILSAQAENLDPATGLATQWRVTAANLAGLNQSTLRLKLANSTGIVDRAGNTGSYNFAATTGYTVSTQAAVLDEATLRGIAGVNQSTVYFGQQLSVDVYFTSNVILKAGKTIAITALSNGHEFQLISTGTTESAAGVQHLVFTSPTALTAGWVDTNGIDIKANSLTLLAGTTLADFRDVNGNYLGVQSFAQISNINGTLIDTQGVGWTDTALLTTDSTQTNASGYVAHLSVLREGAPTVGNAPQSKYTFALLDSTTKYSLQDADALRDTYRINLSTGAYELASMRGDALKGAAVAASDINQLSVLMDLSGNGRWVAMTEQGVRNPLLDMDLVTTNGVLAWTAAANATNWTSVPFYVRNLIPGSSVFLYNSTTGTQVVGTTSATVDANGYATFTVPTVTQGATTSYEVRASTNTAATLTSAQFLLSETSSVAQGTLVIKDMQTGELRIVADPLAASNAHSSISNAKVIGDGSVVIFESAGTQFSSGQTSRADRANVSLAGVDNNGTSTDVFAAVWNSGTSRYTITRLTGVANAVNLLDVSADGRYVLAKGLVSVSGGALVAGGTAVNQIVLYDRTSAQWKLVSANALGAVANNLSDGANFSPDGDQIVFHSLASDIVAAGADSNNTYDVFLVNLTGNGVSAPTLSLPTRVSLDTGGAQIANSNQNATLSTDGTKLAFRMGSQAMLRDLTTNTLYEVGTNSTGVSVTGTNYSVISPDGSTVMLLSTTGSIIPAFDTNGSSDLYFRRLAMIDLDTTSDTAGSSAVSALDAYDNMTSATNIALTASYLVSGLQVRLQETNSANGSWVDVTGTTVTVGSDGKAHFTVNGFYDTAVVSPITWRTYRVVNASTGVAIDVGGTIANALTVYRDPAPSPHAPSVLTLAGTTDAGVAGGYLSSDNMLQTATNTSFTFKYTTGQNITSFSLFKDINNDGFYTVGTDTILASKAPTDSSGTDSFSGINLAASAGSTVNLGVIATNSTGAVSMASNMLSVSVAGSGRALGAISNLNRATVAYYQPTYNDTTLNPWGYTNKWVAPVGPVNVSNTDSVAHSVTFRLFADVNNNGMYDVNEAVYWQQNKSITANSYFVNSIFMGNNSAVIPGIALELPTGVPVTNLRSNWSVDGVEYTYAQGMSWNGSTLSNATYTATGTQPIYISGETYYTASAINNVLDTNNRNSATAVLDIMRDITTPSQTWSIYATSNALYRQNLTTGQIQDIGSPTNAYGQDTVSWMVRSATGTADGKLLFIDTNATTQAATSTLRYASSTVDANADGNLDNAYGATSIVVRDLNKVSTDLTAFAYVARVVSAQANYESTSAVHASNNGAVVAFDSTYDFSNPLYSQLSTSYFAANASDLNNSYFDAANLYSSYVGREDVFVAIKQSNPTDIANPYSIYRLTNTDSTAYAPATSNRPGSRVLDVSADGRWVAFGTLNNYGSASDNNNLYDVYIADTQNITNAPVWVSKVNGSTAAGIESGTGGARFFTSGGTTQLMFWTAAALDTVNDPTNASYSTSANAALGDLYKVSWNGSTWSSASLQRVDAPLLAWTAPEVGAVDVPSSATLDPNFSQVADRRNLVQADRWDINSDGSKLVFGLFSYDANSALNNLDARYNYWMQDTSQPANPVGYDISAELRGGAYFNQDYFDVSNSADSRVQKSNAQGLEVNNLVSLSNLGWTSLNMLKLAQSSDTGAGLGADATTVDGITRTTVGLVINASALAPSASVALTTLIGSDRVLVAQATSDVNGTASFTIDLGRTGRGASLALSSPLVINPSIAASSGNTLAEGATTRLTFSFDSAVNIASFTTADLIVTGGTLSALTSVDATTWTANFTRTASTGPVGVAFNANAVSSPLQTSTLNNTPATWTANTGAPTPSITLYSGSSSPNVGDTVTLQIVFSSAISSASFAPNDLIARGGTLSSLRSVGTDNTTWLVDFLRTNSADAPAPAVSMSSNAVMTNTNIGNAPGAWVGTTAPWTTLNISDTTGGTLNYGETHRIKFQFAQVPIGFTQSDLVLTGGSVKNFSVDAADATVYWADFTRDRVEAAASVRVEGSSYTNASGHRGQQGMLDWADTSGQQPTVTISAANSAVAANIATVLTLTFKVPSGWIPQNFDSTDIVAVGGSISAVSALTQVNATTWTATATFTRDSSGLSASVAVLSGSWSAYNPGMSTSYALADMAGNLYTDTRLANNLTIANEVRPTLPWALALTAGDNGAYSNDQVLSLTATGVVSGLTISGKVATGQGVDTVKLYIDKNNNGVRDSGEDLATITGSTGLNTTTGVFSASGVSVNLSDAVPNVTTSFGLVNQLRVRADAINSVTGHSSNEFQAGIDQNPLNLWIDTNAQAGGLAGAYNAASFQGQGVLISTSAGNSAASGSGFSQYARFVGNDWLTYRTSDVFAGDTNGMRDIYRVNMNTGVRQLVSSTSMGAAQSGSGLTVATNDYVTVEDGAFKDGSGVAGTRDWVLMRASGVANTLVTAANSAAQGLSAGTKTYTHNDLVVKDMSNGSVTLLARGASGFDIGASFMSDDGSVVVYATRALQGVNGETSTYAAQQVFARFLNADGSWGSAVRISSGNQGNASAYNLMGLSNDGQTVLVTTTAGVLDTDALQDYYAINLNTLKTAAFGSGASTFNTVAQSAVNTAYTSAVTLVGANLSDGTMFSGGAGKTPSTESQGTVYNRTVTVGGNTYSYREVLFQTIASGADTATGNASDASQDYLVRTLGVSVNGAAETALTTSSTVYTDAAGSTTSWLRRITQTGGGLTTGYVLQGEVASNGTAVMASSTGRILVELGSGRAYSLNGGVTEPFSLANGALSADGQWSAFSTAASVTSAGLNLNSTAGTTAVADTNGTGNASTNTDVVARRHNLLWLVSDTGDSASPTDVTTFDSKTVQTSNVVIKGVRGEIGSFVNNPDSAAGGNTATVLYELTLDGTGAITGKTAVGSAMAAATTGAVTFTLATLSTGTHTYAMGDVAGNLYTDAIMANQLTVVEGMSWHRITDDVGALTGNVLTTFGTPVQTDDATLVFGGTLVQSLSAGQVLKVYDGSTALTGAVSFAGNGKDWTFTTPTLQTGTHVLSLQLENNSAPGVSLLTLASQSVTVQSTDPVLEMLSNNSISLNSTGQLLDLTMLPNTHAINQVNLNQASNVLKLNLSDVLSAQVDAFTNLAEWGGALSAGAHQMVVKGAGTVNMTDGVWRADGVIAYTTDTMSTHYNVYSHVSGSVIDAQLLLAENVTRTGMVI